VLELQVEWKKISLMELVGPRAKLPGPALLTPLSIDTINDKQQTTYSQQPTVNSQT
jgi:hypothetical protein